MAVNDTLAQEIQAEGFTVIRDFFAPEEIARLRETVSGHFVSGKGVRGALGRVQPNAAIEVSGLDWLYSLDKVVELFRRALGTEDIVFTGHCDIHRDIRSGWHKDSGKAAGDYFHGDYFGADDCRVYKMAVYLEDHASDACGLTVAPRSHRAPGLGQRDALPLGTRAGDVILFDVRLSHRGQHPDSLEKMLDTAGRASRLLRGANDNVMLSGIHDGYLHRKGMHPRHSVFFTFGYPNRFTEDFARLNMARQLRQTGQDRHRLSEPLTAALAQRGVRLASVLTN